TSGILIGIGETRRERIQSLLDLRASHERYGHIQEIIVQNFRAKPNTPMAGFPEPSTEELVWTIAMARLIFPADMNIQAPPNLSAEALDALVDAGLNDWGGVSPVTPDHVNPEAPWPHLAALERATNAAGKSLVQRLPVYPRYIAQAQRWLDNRFMPSVRQAVDAQGFVRGDRWFAGADSPMPPADIARLSAPALRRYPAIARAIARAQSGITLNEDEIVGLFGARDDAFSAVCRAADEMRKVSNGDTVTYVVNRNINYTNICFYKCAFCAFSKGKLSENLRGRPYLLEADEIERRVQEASDRGATEICMQGGIHPDFTGRTYLDLCKTVRRVAPAIHIHAFSPLEIWHGAQTLALSLPEFLSALIEAGLNSLPGTAAEILDDEVRKDLCPDKINTAQWFEVMEAAHRLGLSSTATIMFGHIDRPEHWARHLLRIRALQNRTGGFTEFVPLPFVHMESPVYLKGRARRGPTFREAVLMHAVARLVLYPHITNVQTSWVKMGPEGAALCLAAGANDLGGTLMNETITRSAGAVHGQEMSPAVLERLVLSAGREPAQRTNRYDVVRSEGHPVPVGQALPARSGLSRNWS
ncbi:MAG: 5-amino-6-(D-ribitylamino)uracil--L-tyrosine 4-hydroxyphenyl transferase CofH, partial [Pseudorhodoplanes sp.]